MRSSFALLTLVAAIAACSGPRSRRDPPAMAAASVQAPELVRLRIGDGPMGPPIANPALQPTVLELAFPAEFAGRRVDLEVDRCRGADRVPWLHIAPLVPADGALRIAGVPAGRYELRAVVAGVPVEGAIAIDGADIDRVTVAMRPVAADAAPLRR